MTRPRWYPQVVVKIRNWFSSMGVSNERNHSSLKSSGGRKHCFLSSSSQELTCIPAISSNRNDSIIRELRGRENRMQDEVIVSRTGTNFS
mmetsp:Transcript_51469/g.134424  ORF Transcript_51469/g.134424 Transcript_51469/m.134424 type:complete len:90 (+) Transcript_51469:940-1209(+)